MEDMDEYSSLRSGKGFCIEVWESMLWKDQIQEKKNQEQLCLEQVLDQALITRQ